MALGPTLPGSGFSVPPPPGQLVWAPGISALVQLWLVPPPKGGWDPVGHPPPTFFYLDGEEGEFLRPNARGPRAPKAMEAVF